MQETREKYESLGQILSSSGETISSLKVRERRVVKVHKKSEILHGPLYSLQDPLSYMGRLGLGFLGQRGGN